MAVSGKEQKRQSDRVKRLPRLVHGKGTSYLFKVTWGVGVQNRSCDPSTPPVQCPEYQFSAEASG